jgi:hypothetical protein
MAYNKKSVLEQNIKAIEIAFSGTLLSEQEINILKDYKGFGGIKAVLLPPNNPGLFTDADKNLIEPLTRLHQLLLDNSKDRAEYDRYLLSIKNSVLTSFYTPETVVCSIGEVFRELNVQNMLEPSAGAGVFLDQIAAANKTAIEKDLITGKILTALHPDKQIMIQGFEKMQRKYELSFDLVTSNIPFGAVPVFDPVFVNGKNKVRKESVRCVHNYFFLKGMDMLQEGGVLAFVTSTGMMDSAGNDFMRRALLKEARLISSIRLPHNLFVNTGGIEVSSDLIVLQKCSQRDTRPTKEEKLFLSSGNSFNDYYQDLSHVVHSKREIKKNQFGKETTEFYQEGGEEVIARKLKNILDNDMSKNFNHELFTGLQEKMYTGKTPVSQSGQLSLFDEPVFFASQMKIPFNLEEDSGKKEYDRYLYLKEAYFELKNTERNMQKENASARDLLNKRYDSYVDEYGFLLHNRNTLIIGDEDFLELIGLEKQKGRDIEKADIFFEPVSIKKSLEVASVQEALNISLNEFNYIDIDYICLLCGKLAEESKTELLDSKQIYYNPVSDEYQLSSQFLSGNVIEKRDLLLSCIDNFLPGEEGSGKIAEVKQSIKALEEAIPKPLPLNEIGINLGERWIPERYYVEFSRHLLNPPGIRQEDVALSIYTCLPQTIMSCQKTHTVHTLIRSSA